MNAGTYQKVTTGLIVGAIAEVGAISYAQQQNPQEPDYIRSSLIAAVVGIVAGVLDPPVGGAEPQYYPVRGGSSAYYRVVRMPRSNPGSVASTQTFTNLNEAKTEAGREARRNPGDGVTIEGTTRAGQSYDAAVWADENGRLNWTEY